MPALGANKKIIMRSPFAFAWGIAGLDRETYYQNLEKIPQC